jgi:hypothetical protein
MSNNFEIVTDVAATVQEILGLSSSKYYEEFNFVFIRGLTRFNFAIGVKQFAKNSEWRLLVEANGLASKDSSLEEHLGDIVNQTEFVRNSSKRVQYEFRSHDIDQLVDAAQSLREFVDSADLGSAKVVESRFGVTFQGTQFDRLKERGATMSGMFGNLVCQVSGMNLLMTQAEYHSSSGQIDGVELAENGDVISIYECQSGVHHGQELDADHLAKTLGTYLYDPEIIPTVRKVVLLAGAYNDDYMLLLKERAYELSRRERAIELVVLITTRVENRIGVERVVL